MECRGSVGGVFGQHSTHRKAFTSGFQKIGWSGDVFCDFCPSSLIFSKNTTHWSANQLYLECKYSYLAHQHSRIRSWLSLSRDWLSLSCEDICHTLSIIYKKNCAGTQICGPLQYHCHIVEFHKKNALVSKILCIFAYETP